MNIQKEISWEMALRVWWHFIWRYAFFGVLAAMVSGMLIGFIGGMANLDLHTVTKISIVFGIVLTFFVNLWVVRNVLTKKNRISKYRLVLVEDLSTAEGL